VPSHTMDIRISGTLITIIVTHGTYFVIFAFPQNRGNIMVGVGVKRHIL
jgi:hypothetical protein